MATDLLGLPEHGILRRGRLGVALACLLAAAAGPALASETEAAASGRASTGRLQGSVVVGPELTLRRIRFNLYGDPAQTANLPSPPTDGQELQNVVIYFEPAASLSAGGPPRSERPVMRQEELTFVPHVLAVLKGMTVDFPNGDAIFHNVFSLSKAAAFDLGRFPRGSSRSVRFERPGVVKVFCHIHSDMSGVILVLDNPFFTVPDAGGHYAIDGLPAGDYTVVGWHERARPLRRTVRIQPGQSTSLNFIIPLKESADGE